MLKKTENKMFYIITGIPLAAVFAAVQFFLCKKAERNIIKLLPIFISAGALLLSAFIRGENLLASAVYGFLGQGIFALVVLLWLLAIGTGLGAIIGWIFYLIKK